MDNKHFVPNIEDFHIGYEYEIYTPNNSDYIQAKIESSVDLLFVENCFRMNVQDAWMRTAHLTKEQIEAEGWVYQMNIGDKLEFELNNVWKIGGGFLTYIPSKNFIQIRTVDVGYNIDGPNHSTKFKGKCKCINEFKKIIKYLNIQ